LISTYEISKIFKKRYNVELSQSTIYNRIKRLEESNVILNYSINFKPKKVGFKGKFVVRIKPKDSSKYSELALSLVKRDEIVYLFRMGEQYGLFAIVRVKRIEDFGDFIKNLYESEDMEDTYTYFVLDELKPYTNFKMF
jgi:DNA-binding Lrp family transcriptional regulator